MGFLGCFQSSYIYINSFYIIIFFLFSYVFGVEHIWLTCTFVCSRLYWLKGALEEDFGATLQLSEMLLGKELEWEGLAETRN